MTGLLWKPYAPEYIRDPYKMYKQLREQDPVHQAQTGEWIVTRYEDIKSILKNPSLMSGNRLEWLKRGIHYFQNKDEDFKAIYEAMNSFILMLNPPQHTRLRNFVSKSWDNRMVDAIIHQNVQALLNQFPEKEFDIVGQYAQPLPVLTISHILGIPSADCNYLKDLGIRMTKALDLYVTMKDMVSMNDAAKSFITFFAEQVRQKTDAPGDDLISKMIRKNQSEKTGLTDAELISMCIFIFLAGEETLSGLISNGIYTLYTYPDQLHRVREDSSLMENALEEVLRFESVVQLLGRVTSSDIAIGEKVIPEGAAVTLVLGSANRDDLAFSNPDEFDITRSPNRHLAFGSGIHFCLGDWLARIQGKIAIQAFMENYPQIKFLGEDRKWYNNLAIRSLETLRVTC